MATLPLRAENEHDFYVPELQFEFAFDWDAKGRVKEMLWARACGRCCHSGSGSAFSLTHSLTASEKVAADADGDEDGDDRFRDVECG